MNPKPINPESEAPTIIVDGGVRRDPAQALPLPRLDERYKITSVQGGPGKSGMGLVYIVQDGDRRLAVKTFQHRFAQNLPLVERFLREARTWILLGFHPNIVHAYSIDIIDATPYLFMEYIQPTDDGLLSLADWVQRGPMAIPQAVDLALQCCEGMIHATRAVAGLVHRDLKPENLFITRDGVLKISDFGLVRNTMGESVALMLSADTPELPGLTQVGMSFGTPAYMAPEQFASADKVGQSADIYALGCCFYEAIAGERLFTIRASTPLEEVLRWREFHERYNPAPLIEKVPDCPQDLDYVLNRCLQKDPAARWDRFIDLRDALIPVWEKLHGRSYSAATHDESQPVEVAEQFRSLKVLDGYTRAVRMSTLRAHVDSSPYAFHIALASYFHCRGDAVEEQRQLTKALNCRGSNPGTEAVRRLSLALLNGGNLHDADALLATFLKKHEDMLHECIEPFVRLCIAMHRQAEAEAALQRMPQTPQVLWLSVLVFESLNRQDKAARVLEMLLHRVLDRICTDLAYCDPGEPTGWDYAGDAALLIQVIAILRPAVDAQCLALASEAVWPVIDAFPTFAAPMAWLSEVIGKLAYMPTDMPAAQIDACRQCAQILGYPERLRAHLMRDEYWFWALESGG